MYVVSKVLFCLYYSKNIQVCIPTISIGRANLIVHIKFLLIKSPNTTYITMKSPQLHYRTNRDYYTIHSVCFIRVGCMIVKVRYTEK